MMHKLGVYKMSDEEGKRVLSLRLDLIRDVPGMQELFIVKQKGEDNKIALIVNTEEEGPDDKEHDSDSGPKAGVRRKDDKDAVPTHEE